MVQSNYSYSDEQLNKNQYTVASVTDRLLAFAIDAFLFAPFCSLILAPLIKRFQVLRLHDSESTELLVFLAVITVCYVAVMVFVQFFFLMISQGTPGKVFMKLKVVSVANPNGRMVWTQAFLRSFFWVLDIIPLALPFLEILSHKDRRPLHDRVSETMVVTLKQIPSDIPHKFEITFIRQILIVSFAFFIFWGFSTLSDLHRQALNGNFKKDELLKSNYLCSEISSKTELRLDHALALYLADEVSEDCLNSEVEVVIWAPKSEERDWALLAKAYLNEQDKEKFQSYSESACPQNHESAVCDIVRGNEKVPRSVTAAVLKMKQNLASGNFADVEKLIQVFPHSSKFSNFLANMKIKATWMSGEKEKAAGGYEVAALNQDKSTKLSSWMCAQEGKQHCESGRAFRSCYDLKKSLSYGEELSENDIYALVLERECRKSSDPILIRFQEDFADNKPLAKLTAAISSETKLSFEQRQNSLLSLVSDASATHFVQNEALFHLLKHSKSEAEIKKALEFANNPTISTYEYQMLMANAKASAKKLNSEKLLSYLKQREVSTLSPARVPASEKAAK